MTSASQAGARSIGIAARADHWSALSAFLAAAIFLMLALMPAAAKMRHETLRVKTATAEHHFKIEVAVDEEDKRRGLMFRRSVPALTGMLFPYDAPEEVTMWMQNTYVSLDMIFIRADGVIHRIAKRTEPLSERIIASEGAVTAVLEIAAGEADRLGISPGDRVVHPHFTEKR
ncbi:MAG: DUF192 domain-containing protein [Hyphomicrobiaceae bacterium]